jgi:uncharacterized protein YbbC (DUF1343 family)
VGEEFLQIQNRVWRTIQPVLAILAPLLVLGALSPAAHATHRHARRARGWRVQTGIDVLESQKFAPLRGKHVGLITNHTGVDYSGRSTIDLLEHASGVDLVALFSPEHGLAGTTDEKVTSSRDPVSGLPVYSLYGDTRRPTDEMLKGVDTLVFDVQDAGVRFYTYTTTMGYCMEEAAKHHIAFYVLDRPNPISGDIVEGPMLDPDRISFVAYFPLPVRYGLTIGELAQLFNTENHIGADLHVIAMRNWHRNYFFDSTGVRWIPPSPNLRTTKGAILYPGLEILLNAGVSVGRGTETPFEEFGAPWLDGDEVAAALNARHLPGLRFSPHPFIPVTGIYMAQRCGGVAIRVTNRGAVRSMRMGMEIAVLLHKVYPKEFDTEKMLHLTGNAETVKMIEDGASAEQIVASWSKDLDAFDQMRRKYFLYK